MAEAEVKFYTEDWQPAEPGKEQVFSFKCPRKNARCEGLTIAGRTDLKRDPQGQNGGVAQWDWDGNRDRPTFSPSVNCQRCWHGYIRNGRTVSTSGADEILSH